MQSAMQHNSIGKVGPVVVPQGAFAQANQRMNVLSPNNGKAPNNQNSHQIVNNFLNNQDINGMSKTSAGVPAQPQMTSQKQTYHNKTFSNAQVSK